MKLAVVIPVYNEEKALIPHIKTIYEILVNDGIEPAFMLVDDGSKDRTWQKILELQNEIPDLHAVRFARNFGKEMALCAGIDAIDADRYLIMDSDLQHPPRYIKAMMEIMDENGADIVEGVKESRGKESLKYKLLAKSFYHILTWATALDLDNSSDFKLMDRKVIDYLRTFTEKNVFFRGLVDFVGFKKVQFAFEVDDRDDGSSRFSTLRLMRLAFNAILSYTSKPLYITVGLGALFFLFAIVLGIQTLFNFFSGHAVSGFSTVILLNLLIGSLILFSLGIIGVYISRIYDEVKARPRYVISKKI